MWESYEDAEARALTPYEETFAQADGFEEAHDIVMGRCSMCHSRDPYYSDSMLWAPKGVLLDTPADIARNARAIYIQAGVSHAMPPANITMMSNEDRAAIVSWYRNADTF